MSVLPKSIPKKSKPSAGYKNDNHNENNTTLILNTCMKILVEEPLEQINKWLIENKITSTQLKNEKLAMVMNHTQYVLKTMLVDNEDPQSFLIRMITYYKYNNKKSYEFCRCLKHFAARDYQIDYILSMAKGSTDEPVSFYLKCRSAVVQSHLNKAKRDTMGGIIASAEEWFNASKKIFRGVAQTELIEVFTDTCRSHYMQIKKNQNEDLHGDEFFKVCLIINKILEQKKGPEYYSCHDQESEYIVKQPNQQPRAYINNEKMNGQTSQRPKSTAKTPSKEAQIKRLFQANVIEGLESEDRQLIRMLSYRDTNIARLLEKKHEKMIQLIANEVEDMRQNIEIEKKKYIDLCRQKDQIIDATENLNSLALDYIRSHSYENEQSLMKAIESFSKNHGNIKNKNNMVKEVGEARECKKNERLIELIEREERELD